MLVRASSGSGGGGGSYLYLDDTVTQMNGDTINTWYDTGVSASSGVMYKLENTSAVFGNVFIGYIDSTNSLQTLFVNSCEVKIENGHIYYKSTYRNSNVKVGIYKAG